MEIPFSHKRDYCWSAPRPLPTCPVSWIVGLLLFAAKLGVVMRSFQLQNFLTC